MTGKTSLGIRPWKKQLGVRRNHLQETCPRVQQTSLHLSQSGAASDEMQNRKYQWVDSTSYFMGKFKPKQRRNAISVPALEEDERQMWDLGGVQVEKQLGTDFVESKVPAKKPHTKMTLVKGSKKEKSLKTAEDHWRFPYTTVDWSAQPVYFRKLWTRPATSPGAKPIPIVVNKLTADLRFWVEVYK
nr:hypothetical protein BaRGS_030129 [Batillaria attramentaria]